jgi:hypothetical protein
MSAGCMWRKIDESDWLKNLSVDAQDCDLYYGRIYTVGQDYRFSETNQQIYNLKISPSKIKVNPDREHFKSQAISKFSSEVMNFLFNENLIEEELEYILIPIPPSKPKSHDEYDDRMEKVANDLSRYSDNLRCLPILNTRVDRQSSHTGGSRDVETIFQSMTIDTELISDGQNIDKIFVIDDVLTSGASFSAAKRCLSSYFPNVPVAGIFWAKSEHPGGS